MLNTIKNPYITISPSNVLLETFEEICAEEKIVPETVKLLAENKFKEGIQLQHISWLKKKLPPGKHIYKLLENCDISLPEPEAEPRNPELEARIQKLKAQAEERRYQAMTRNVDVGRGVHPEDSIAHQVKEINRQLLGVFQVLVSIGTGFAFGFIGIEWIVGSLDVGFRLLLGLAVAIVIGIAELYFFVKKIAEPIDPPVSKKNN